MKNTRKIKSSGELLVGFNYHFADGRKAYYFLLVNTLKKQLLSARLKADTAFNIQDYGVLVASGYGDPDKGIKDFLHEEYGVDLY